MFEKVNPCHPDKVADRIAGAVVDLAYKAEKDPKIAVEVLIGHGQGHVIIETSAKLDKEDIAAAVFRIAGDIRADIQIVPQDAMLAENQSVNVHCGDNGIFKGMPVTEEQKALSKIARDIYSVYPMTASTSSTRLVSSSARAMRKVYISVRLTEVRRSIPWVTGRAVRM